MNIAKNSSVVNKHCVSINAINMSLSKPVSRWALGLVGTASLSAIIWHIYKHSKTLQLKDRRLSILTSLRNQVASECEIIIVESHQEWDDIAARVQGALEAHPFVGFDLEWVSPRNGEPKPVALMQLSFYDGWTVLVRLNKLEWLIPESLGDILTDGSIMKIGVGVFGDAKKLREDYDVGMRGSLDLRHYVPQFRPELRATGLAGLASAFIGVKLDKDWKIRASDWEAGKLTQRQVDYAANDAFVATHIFLQIAFESLDNSDQLNDIENVEDLAKYAYKMGKQYYGVPYRSKGTFSNNKKPNKHTGKNKHAAGAMNPAKKYGKILPKKTKKFHCATLVSPDGQPLCSCDIRKALWYVDQGLGVIVGKKGDGKKDPITVKLNFEPAGSHNKAIREYHLLDVKHICVVCGEEQSYFRKYIVPHEYRTQVRSTSEIADLDNLNAHV